MKIAWFTPFTKKSAIGKIGALICSELAKDHRVDIWAPRCEDPIETQVPVIQFSTDDISGKLNNYDAVFYNLGNFAGYHREILDVSRKFPGILILHDQTMAAFWGQYHCMPEFGGDPAHGVEAYRAMVREYYGDQAVSAVNQALESGLYPFYEYESLHGYTFLEPIIEFASGVFTHSEFFAKQLNHITNKPIGYAYLPYSSEETTKGEKTIDNIIRQARLEGRKIIVSSGIVHPVKRIDKVTKCLVDYPEIREKICYLVIGDFGGPYGEALCQLENSSLAGCLHMLGYQSDVAMETALKAADLAINLRYPNSEVCSLSLWEQMAAKKPVLVLNRGIYGEVPEDVVIRIKLEEEADGIHQTLLKLINGELDSKMGNRARDFIWRECSVLNYCNRLIEFVGTVNKKSATAMMQRRVIQDLAQKMSSLGLFESSVPATYAAIIDQMAKVFGNQEPECPRKIMAVWIGFAYHIPNLSREGISRLMGYLVSSMLKYHPDVAVEVWSYSFNEEQARITFESVREEDRTRLVFITEKNWKEQLNASAAQVRKVGRISETEDNLITAARCASRASVFVPLILYLDRVTETGKKIFAPGYDMAVAEHYEEFVEKDPLYIARNSDYIWRSNNMAARGGKFFAISDTVRITEIVKYIGWLEEGMSKTIYTPPNVPAYTGSNLEHEDALRKKFSLYGEYLFYPTQIRPYKNVSTLIKAFHIISEEYPDLKLVLTGTPEDVPEVDRILRETGLYSRTILAKGVSERELYSLYHYAAAIPVPSLHEGGFPLQAMEAMFQDAPVILADIPVVKERIRSFGFQEKDTIFSVFSPEDPDALAQCLRTVLEDRPAALERQREFARRLMSYTWKEAVQQYYELFFGETERVSD